MLHGGNNQREWSRGLWAWSDRWEAVRVADPTGDGSPSGRSEHAVVYDPVRAHTLLFGGTDGAARGDTWEWRTAAAGRPGVAMFTELSATGSHPSARPVSVTATWSGGGLGGGPYAPARGAALHVWDAGRWRKVAATRALPEDPGPLVWSTTDPDLLARLAVGPRRTVAVALQPLAENGPWSSRVGVDYAELRVRYRAPVAEERRCADGLDGDLDDAVDCADDDCAAHPACAPDVEAACDDGVDNDGDADIDCADADCMDDPCEDGPETRCVDGLDNDGDGATDCRDLDCYSGCPEGQECHPDGHCTADWVLVPSGAAASSPTTAVGLGSIRPTVCARRIRPPRYPAILRGASVYVGDAATDVPEGGELNLFLATRLQEERGRRGEPQVVAAPVEAVWPMVVADRGGWLDFELPRHVLTHGELLLGFDASARYPCRATALDFSAHTAYLASGRAAAGQAAALAAQHEEQGYSPTDFLIRGRFVCFPDCDGRTCGEDGCGGRCGERCPAATLCTPAGRCVPSATVVAGATSPQPASALRAGASRPLTCARWIPSPSPSARLIGIDIHPGTDARAAQPGDSVVVFYAVRSRLIHPGSGAPRVLAGPVDWAAQHILPFLGRYTTVSLPEPPLVPEGVLVGYSLSRPDRILSCPVEFVMQPGLREGWYAGMAGVEQGSDLLLPSVGQPEEGPPLGPLLRAVFAVPAP